MTTTLMEYCSLKIINRTQNKHRCWECNNIILKGVKAIAIVTKENDMPLCINYLCGHKCLNEAELKQGENTNEQG